MTEVPLHAAAALAYQEIFSTRPEREPSNDELDLVALVLSGYLPIHAGQTGPLAERDLVQGMFWGGARRFESKSGPPLGGLTVHSRDLEQALARIRADLWSES